LEVLPVVDARGLKQRIDLTDLIGTTHLFKVAGTRGGEYAGACPFCGGTDRFRLQPARGLWWCRQCSPDDRWQDAIAFVMKRDGVDFREACARLGNGTPLEVSTTVDKPKPVPQTVTPPSVEWQATAEQIVAECEAALWGVGAVHARTYLAERGLNADTACAWRLGFNPRDRKIAGQWVEAGIIIPWLYEGAVWNLKVRRRQPKNGQRYTSVAGGRPLIYGAHTLDQHDIAVQTEGELDAVLVHQYARDVVSVFTLGSALANLPAQAIPYLLPLRRILLAYDADQTGERGAAKMAAISRRMVRITPPVGKDIGEFWKAGGDVRGWISTEMERLKLPAPQPQRLRPNRCDAEGCELALAEPRDDMVGGWCLQHVGHAQLVTFAALLGFPRLETNSGVIDGPTGWWAFACRADSAAVARAADQLGGLS
jgi:phage/plasmid primase-like uncharacterized protein